MKKVIPFLIFLLILIFVFMAIWLNRKEPVVSVNVPAPKSWFASSTTTLPDSVTPFLNDDTTNATFHLWAWQEFLALTRSNDKTAPFQKYIQVDNDTVPLGNMIQLRDSSQAGTNGVMYDKAGRAVYYTMHVNKPMYDFQQKYRRIFGKIFANHQGKSNRDALINAELKQKGYDTINYPVGCVELKTSWMLASSLDFSKVKRSDYYITWAMLNGKKVKVALIGMHVVGRVANHPEFIWATFEHDEMVPDYAWSYSGYPHLGDTLSNKDYLFYEKGNVIGNCLMNNNSASFAQFSSIFNIYPLGIARSFTDNTLPTTLDKLNNATIVSLNANVKKQLKRKGEVWQHYFYKGSIWLDAVTTNYGPGNGYLGVLTNPSLRGSRAVSNITMETFAQLNFSGNYTTESMNCFGCHATVDYKNVQPGTNDSLSYNLALSHLFKNTLMRYYYDSIAP
jgi:hypothetical protein